jgi:hypothetical protein
MGGRQGRYTWELQPGQSAKAINNEERWVACPLMMTDYATPHSLVPTFPHSNCAVRAPSGRRRRRILHEGVSVGKSVARSQSPSTALVREPRVASAASAAMGALWGPANRQRCITSYRHVRHAPASTSAPRSSSPPEQVQSPTCARESSPGSHQAPLFSGPGRPDSPRAWAFGPALSSPRTLELQSQAACSPRGLPPSPSILAVYTPQMQSSCSGGLIFDTPSPVVACFGVIPFSDED